MNVSNAKKYSIPTAGPMRGRISLRGLVWLAYFAFLLACLLTPWWLLR